MEKFEYGDEVRFKYNESDLESEDLGMSGIVLESPLSGFDLNATYIFTCYFPENPIHCLIRRSKTSQFHKMIQVQYLEKV